MGRRADCPRSSIHPARGAGSQAAGVTLTARSGRLDLLDINDVGWILARVAGRAISNLLAFAARLLQAFQREIGQGVRSDIVANLVDGFVGGDELLFRWRVDPIIAGRNRWRTRDAHMHLGGTRVSDHPNNFAARGSAHDRVINQNDAFPFKQRSHRVEFQLHPKVANALAGLDESATDIVVADQSKTKWDATLGCVADGSRYA